MNREKFLKPTNLVVKKDREWIDFLINKLPEGCDKKILTLIKFGKVKMTESGYNKYTWMAVRMGCLSACALRKI